MRSILQRLSSFFRGRRAGAKRVKSNPKGHATRLVQLSFLGGPMDGWHDTVDLPTEFPTQSLLKMPISESIFHVVAGAAEAGRSSLVTSVARYRLDHESVSNARDFDHEWNYVFDGAEPATTNVVPQPHSPTQPRRPSNKS